MAESRAHSKPGPINENVGKNLLRIRTTRKSPDEKRATTTYVAEQVSALGVPMTASTITKIEKGLRRVTVDELVALAIALDVSPVPLLLPGIDEITYPDDDIENTAKMIPLTDQVSQPWEIAWRWMHGTDQLSERLGASRFVNQSKFFAENRPYDRGLRYEIERELLDRVTDRPTVVVGFVGDAGMPEVNFHHGPEAERLQRRLTRDDSEDSALWRARGWKTGATMPPIRKPSSGPSPWVGSRQRVGGSAGMTRTASRDLRPWCASPMPTPSPPGWNLS